MSNKPEVYRVTRLCGHTELQADFADLLRTAGQRVCDKCDLRQMHAALVAQSILYELPPLLYESMRMDAPHAYFIEHNRLVTYKAFMQEKTECPPVTEADVIFFSGVETAFQELTQPRDWVEPWSRERMQKLRKEANDAYQRRVQHD